MRLWPLPLLLAAGLAGLCALPGRADYHRHRVRDAFIFLPSPPPPVIVPTPAPASVPAAPPAPATAPPPVEDVEGLPRVRGWARGARRGAQRQLTRTPAVDPERVAAVLGSCIQCHSSPSGKGRVNLFDEGGTFAPGPGVGPRVYEAVRSGEMPPKGPPLGPQDVDLLRRWSQETPGK